MKNLIKLAKSNRKSLPVLRCIQFSPDGSALATDLTSWHIAYSASTGLKNTVIVSAAEVEIALKISKTLIFTDDDTLLNGIALSREHAPVDFPAMPSPTAQPLHRIDLTKQKIALLEQVAIAAAKKEIRYYLIGVCFDFAEGAIIATDGHRLHRAGFMQKVADGKQYIVPIAAVNSAVKNKANSIIFHKNQAVIMYNEAHCVVKYVDGKYPDYHRVIPTGRHDVQIDADAKKLAECLKIAVMAPNTHCYVAMDFDAGKIKSGLLAQADCGFPPTPGVPTVGVNGKYMLDAIRGEKTVTLYVLDCISSIVAICDEMIAVVMPTRGSQFTIKK